MVFIESDDELDEDGRALKTDMAKRESARNVIQSIHDDILNPKMYIQDTDPETGFPLGKHLVEGGIEYFNDHETGMPEASEHDIDAILSGDVSIEDAMKKLRAGPNIESPRSVVSPPSAKPVPAVATNVPPRPKVSFELLGLPFLREVPGIPDQLVQIRFSGMTSFQIPFPCHAVVQAEQLILLVTDKRSVPVFNDLDIQIDRQQVQAELVLPDQTTIPVVAPVPRTVTFELGILRCTMFLRRPA